LFPLLYEINTRCWLASLSTASGRRVTLASIPDSEFEFFERCGFTHVWLMGVWTLGTRGRSWSRRCYAGREDEFGCSRIAGSPYAITGYDVSRRLGGESGLARFRQALNRRGIQLVLDVIPNHTAIDHPWVREHPDYFVTSPASRPGFLKPFRHASHWFAHGDCGHGNPWVDTLQLDYTKPAVHEAMTRELIRVSERCDGVRCDMAMLALADVFSRTWQLPASGGAGEFWPNAMAAVRRHRRDFLFIAEVYWDLEERLQALGFDFTYNKRLYDRLVAHDGAGAIAYLNSLTPEFLARSTHFLENHDEPRIAGLLDPDEHRAAALLVTALPGMRLFHEGQLTGARKHANVHFAERSDEAVDASIHQFYRTLFAALPNTAVGSGKPLLDPARAWEGNDSNQNFVLVLWQKYPGAFDLAVINLAPHPSQCFAPVHVARLEGHDWNVRDLLGSEQYVRTGRELAGRGFYLDVPAHAAQLFHFSRSN
jgi:hypothetical protein